MNIRLLNTGPHPAAWNMALDEVLISRIASGKSEPCLRFYAWEPSAVSIGYFQCLESEVDTVKCRELGIDVVRRQTGGGAVFHDDEITYSIHLPMSLNLVPVNILESYRSICNGILFGLGKLGITAEFAPLNDIIVKGQKISGNAQTRKQGVILQHGTILNSVDVDKMFDLLKVPDEKMKGKLIENIKQRVTSIQSQTGTALPFDTVVEALTAGFEQQFYSEKFLSSSLTEEEIFETEKLAQEKYAGKIWNSQR